MSLRPEGNLTNRFAVEFRVPGGAEQSWHRLTVGSGSGADVENVLGVLRKEWSISSSDPRALRLWLLEQGFKLEGLRHEEVSEAKRDFERYQTTKRRNTEELIGGVLSGPSVLNFFLGLRTCPTELKELAFCKALSSSMGESLVLVLVALSRESPELIQSCVNDAPESPVVRNFRNYLQFRAIPSPPTHAQPEQQHRVSEEGRFEQLFELISLRPVEIKTQLSKITAKQISELTDRATRFLQSVPNEGYGEFLRFELAAFVCIAEPENVTGNDVIDYLATQTDTSRAELLGFIGQRRAGDLLSRLITRNSPDQAALIASVLDVIRTHYPVLLKELPDSQLAQLSNSKNAVTALSGHAALLLLGSLSEDTFARFVRKKIKSDKKGSCILWLAANPRFLDYVSLEKVPLQGWNYALQNLAGSDPLGAMRLLDNAFARPAEKTDRRRWDEAFKALSRIPFDESQSLFTKLAVKLIKESPHAATSILGREPAASLLLRNIWRVCDQAGDEEAWDIAFGAVTNKIADSVFAQWLGESGTTRQQLSQWLRSILLPRLLERQLISKGFLAQISDSSLQVSLVQSLTSQTIQTIRYLQTVAQEWSALRGSAKDKVAWRASVGLRIATRFARPDPTLTRKLTELSQLLQEWRKADAPAVDPALKSISAIQFPEPREKNRELLSEFFSNPPNTPHEATYFFGVNPWAVDLYLSNRASSWPSPNVLLEHIAKSFAYFAALRTRSDALKNDLDDVVRTELGIDWRDTLAEIEEMIGGYFAFRRILSAVGLEEVDSKLGEVVKPEELSSEKHKVIRDPSQRGRPRLLGLGLKVGGRVIGSATVMKSGEDDDRD